MTEENKITPEPIMKIITAPWLAQALYVAVDLEVFTKIAEGKNTVEEISDSLNLEKRPIERILNVCVASEFLVKEGNEYKNTQLADNFLVKGKPDYYGDMVVMFGTRDSL